MNYHQALPQDADFSAWRPHALAGLSMGLSPGQLSFLTGKSQNDLFGQQALPAGRDATAISVSKAFKQQAEAAAMHRDPDRFNLLYRLLWRMTETPHLMQVATDADIVRLRSLAASVRRDIHKMTAFVRFRKKQTEGVDHYIAWFEPDHYIVPRAADFFRRRFTGMTWSILTPDRCAHWDGQELNLTDGLSRHEVERIEDEEEGLWKVYFTNIFNPARLKPKAMQAEMPKKYWRNLPETELIPHLIRTASARTRDMIKAQPTPPPKFHSRVSRQALIQRQATAPTKAGLATDLASLSAQAAACTKCPLACRATQTVFGEGDAHASIMLVGEQPGDREDLTGRPMVGPAGELLNAVLGEAGIDRESCYITNAVKHFKYEPRGKRRLHKRPNAGEVEHCRFWLREEIRLVQPKIIVALGATAMRSLTGYSGRLSDVRGQLTADLEGNNVLATVHPAFILRVQDKTKAQTEHDQMVEDLIRADLSIQGHHAQ